jgi:PAS domain-containing protein
MNVDNALGLLETLLDISLTGVILFKPVYSRDNSQIIDLAYIRLNRAAQQMLDLPECPTESFLTLYPNALQTGIFAFYRDTFLSGKADRYRVNYSYDGLDNYFHLAAQPSGDLLVVSFSDTSDQDRSPVEDALRQSQAAQKAARAEAELQRLRLHEILMQMPAQVAINGGPDHVYKLVNPRYQQQFPNRPILGLPVRQALPELEGQQFFELLDQVYQTGEPFYGQQMPARVDYTNSGHLEMRYFDVFFQALRDTQGRIDGLLNFAYDVTGQVKARQQLEQLNGELEARVQQRTRQAMALQDKMLGVAQRQAKERENFY